MGGAVTGAPGTNPAGAPRPKGRRGRKPKGSVPVVVPETPDKPDPNHVLTWYETLEVLVRPTASPISRIDGG